MPPRHQLLPGRFATQLLPLYSAQALSRSYANAAVIPSPVVKNPLKRRKGGDLGSHLPKNIIPKDAYIPPYPHGDQQLFKQANKGLYGEQTIQFGNNVSRKTKTKTRRQWKPNVLSKSLYSVALKKKIKLRITARTLKTMDREGGLDEYLLKDSQTRIRELGPMGWALRWTLMQTPIVTERLRADAAALGIDQASIDKQWPTAEMMAQQKKEQGNGLDLASFPETEGQEMWEPEDAEGAPPPLTAQEKETIRKASREYRTILVSANRYLERNYVESEEQGIKMVFLRSKERQEWSERHRQGLEERLAVFTTQELEEVRTRLNLGNKPERQVRKIAYAERKHKEIDAAGSVEAWLEAKNKAFLEKRGFERIDRSTYAAQRKAEYGALLHEAETAATNDELSPERRDYLVNALNEANRFIQLKAHGKAAYVKAKREELHSRETTSGNDLSALTGGEGTDAWAAVVDANNRPAETRSTSA